MARKGDESGIYRLTWQTTPEGSFAAWVIGKPNVRAAAKTLPEVELRLHKQIERKLQVGEYMVDWSPPLPVTLNGIWLSDRWVRLSGQVRYFYFGDPKLLWTKGYCRRCGSPVGVRSNRPLDVYVEQGGTIAFCGQGVGPCPGLLVRSDTAKLLGPAILQRSELRKVNRLGRGTIEFLEIRPSVRIRWVLSKGQAAHRLYPRRCVECGTRRSGTLEAYPAHEVPEGGDHAWVDGSFGPELCVRADWWRRNRRKPEFVGVIGERLRVCDPEAISASMKHKPLWQIVNIEKKILEEQRRHAATYGIKCPARSRSQVTDWTVGRASRPPYRWSAGSKTPQSHFARDLCPHPYFGALR